MILEHEIIEQVEEGRRPLARVLDLVRHHGREDAWAVVHALWQAGHVELTEETGARLPSWKVAVLVREDASPSSVYVGATTQGSDWVHGRY